MPLFIRNAEVGALAEEVRKLTKAKTKTEAVLRLGLFHISRNLTKRLSPEFRGLLRDRQRVSVPCAATVGRDCR